MSTEQAQRCFVAWMPTAAERAALASLQDGVRAERTDPGHRWIAAKELHVTLRFLGDTNLTQREAVARSLAELAGESRRFVAAIAGLQYWPSDRNPRVLVLNLASGGALEALGEAVELRMRMVGFAPERRPFRAHLTLARIRDEPPARPVSQAPRPIELMIDHLALVRSTLRAGGSQYEELFRWPLT